MGYNVVVDTNFTFTSTEDLIAAAQSLQSTDVGLVSTVDAAWDVIFAAWDECTENPDWNQKGDEDLGFQTYAFGKWYTDSWLKFRAALEGHAVGSADFADDCDSLWRERLCKDGQVLSFHGEIVYPGDSEDL